MSGLSYLVLQSMYCKMVVWMEYMKTGPHTFTELERSVLATFSNNRGWSLFLHGTPASGGFEKVPCSVESASIGISILNFITLKTDAAKPLRADDTVLIPNWSWKWGATVKTTAGRHYSMRCPLSH